MKSLANIIDKLSPGEIETFRSFLASNTRSSRNKKLELFNTLVDRKTSPKSVLISRQSAYQLKKRLQEQLYSFLVTQEQTKTHDQLFHEMDCHKKLYCFKILFDRGIHDHAYQVLQEVMVVSEKNSLNSLYIDSINLRNTYFPLKKTKTRKDVPITSKIKTLTNTLTRNLYVNQYLTCCTAHLHDSDQSFRQRLIHELVGFEIGESDYVIETLMEINHLFCSWDFIGAFQQLTRLLKDDSGLALDDNIIGLIHIELVKVCICLGKIDAASDRLRRAGSNLKKFESFTAIVLELQFIVAFRLGDTVQMQSTIRRANPSTEFRKNEILMFKWTYFSILMSFQQRHFKDVIKVVNANSTLSAKIKDGNIHAKLLEMLSIFQINDWDWLLYRIDSFRKVVAGLEERFPRILQIVALLKIQASGRCTEKSVLENSIMSLEKEFPWHPFSLELFNFSEFVKLNSAEFSYTSTQDVHRHRVLASDNALA